mmetsp:Transcript_33810/g.46247  ORF Transcript_33810/g.46247 Transcript_33810/m.46247 type:complete len:520 (+) Transcript_33810:20-1579(+)|eukprot:CAMPEP_0201489774 /NCGR_PEP_ID=MMETSP0151_2-20130828/23671_1 /ASSEMBLY_ACC=CAM_ASM_000257 /TAXON_ID=200890 /ORGANISM="Paramoeba atlantica, Strain 621/1 / CCAP 1560/9" /LENGTH=519 /DNA_ID=CAMNT_0047875467 /DNA_START=20 /DNA_END=1579 /DNA_ORIENTATION=-
MAAETAKGLVSTRDPQAVASDAEKAEHLSFRPLVDDLRSFVWKDAVTLPIEFRVEQLKKLRQGFDERCDQILEAVHKDLRKHPNEAFQGEVAPIVSHIDYILANLDEWSKPELVSHPMLLQPGSSKIVYQPKGVVLVIAPWNYPVNLAFVPSLYALAAGNAVVIKPSEVTSHSAQIIEEIVNTYLDPRCCRVVQGAVPETTALLKEKWDHIFYTGNGAVGSIVATAAARHLTPVTLELGGKSPCYIDPSCNVQVCASRIISTKLFNSGQTCVAPDYLLIHKDIKETFVKALVEAAERLVGENPREEESFSRIVNHRHWDRIQRLLQGHNGEIIFGGVQQDFKESREEKFFPLTIVADPSPSSPIMQEEIFGPVLPLLTVNSKEEAASFINSKEPPLALYVFSGDEQVTESVISGTKAGGSCVNDCIFHLANPNLPFGGTGTSGYGHYHGIFGFKEFSHARSVLHRSTWLDNKGRYTPYENKVPMLKKVVIGPLIPQPIKTALLLSAAAAGAHLLFRSNL